MAVAAKVKPVVVLLITIIWGGGAAAPEAWLNVSEDGVAEAVAVGAITTLTGITTGEFAGPVAVTVILPV